MFSKKRLDFSKANLINGFFTAFFFSSFIYFEYFGLSFKFINTIFALLSIYFMLKISRTAMLIAGFFIGLFWFYWVSFSFVYYDLAYLIPLIILGFGAIYAVLFFVVGFYANLLYRAIMLFVLSYLSILGFNWLQFELIFVNSYIGVFKYQLFIVLVAAILSIKFKWYFVFLVLFAIDTQDDKAQIQEPNISIYTPQFYVPQEKRWQREFVKEIIDKNFEEIEFAISKNYELIILPETAFPIVLNKNDELLNILKEYSKQIDIITGSISSQNGNYYNSSYHFSNGDFKIANKVVLVPFGEAIPFPKFLQDFINDTFYGGASDYEKATTPTDFDIKGVSFRNAICYETTTHKIFENLGETKYLVSISNNAWFTPSIQPTLQKILMTYYSRIHKITIYAVANGSDNFIIRN